MSISAEQSAAGLRPPLVERERELRWITAAVRAAERRAGALVVVEGASGTGRSRLLLEAATVARRGDAVVVRARALRSEAAQPLAVVRQLVESPLIAIRDVELAADALVDGLDRELSVLAMERPLVLLVDDATWCDTASLRWLLGLARRAPDLGLTLMVARTCAAPHHSDPGALDQLCHDPSAIVLRLRALGPVGVSSLVSAELGASVAADFGAACHQATAGNPGLVRELALSLAERGIAPTDANAHLVSDVAPASVGRAVLRRAADLAPRAGALLLAMAVMGNEATMADIAQLASLPVATASDLLALLHTADIVDDADMPRFFQPVVPPAILAASPPVRLHRWHRRAAEVLSAGDAAIERVAWHLTQAAPGGDRWVVEQLRLAAERARQCGNADIAAAHLRRALQEGVDELERDLALELGMVEASRSVPDAARLLERGLRLTELPDERAEIGLEIGRVWLNCGLVETAIDAWERARAEPVADADLRQRIEAELLAATRPDATSAGRAIKRLADLQPADGLAALTVLAHRADTEMRRGEDRDRAVALAERALEGDRLLDDPRSSGFYYAVNTLVVADRLDDALVLYDTAVERADSRGLAWSGGAARTFRSWLRWLRGDLAGAIVDAEASIAVADEIGAELGREYPVAHLAYALLDSGEVVRATELIDRALVARNDSFHLAPYLHARALVRLARGTPRQALDDLRACSRLLSATYVRNPSLLPWRSDAAMCHLALGEQAEAVALAEEELELARRWGSPRAIGRALRVVGVVRGGDTRLATLREAARALDGSPARLERARADVELGATLRAAGEDIEAREPLRTGFELADRCGAAPLAARARDELVAAGARPRRAAAAGVDALTKSEYRIALLAAEGRTNRQIAEDAYVTMNTVAAHLRSVYRKLGIGSRAQLTKALEIGAPPDGS